MGAVVDGIRGRRQGMHSEISDRSCLVFACTVNGTLEGWTINVWNRFKLIPRLLSVGCKRSWFMVCAPRMLRKHGSWFIEFFTMNYEPLKVGRRSSHRGKGVGNRDDFLRGSDSVNSTKTAIYRQECIFANGRNL